MPIGPSTPQVSKGFKEWQRAMLRLGPQKLGQVVRAANQLRALTSTARTKR